MIEKSFNSLIKKIKEIDINKKISIEEVEKAFLFAKKAHSWQFRKSWEPYIIHPLEVAKIVLDLKPETETVVSAILHDVVEDTDVSIEDIQNNFWKMLQKLFVD